MKLIIAVFGLAAMCASGVVRQAQTPREKETRTIEVKDGKKITVSGCLRRNPGGGYMLMDRTGDLQYTLVTGRDLTKQLDQFVSISGKATDRGAAKLKIESKVGGDTEKADEATTEIEGDLGLRYLGVDSIETIAPSCR
jgi:hypothetical protein